MNIDALKNYNTLELRGILLLQFITHHVGMCAYQASRYSDTLHFELPLNDNAPTLEVRCTKCNVGMTVPLHLPELDALIDAQLLLESASDTDDLPF